jgi:hypothetical protein
VRNFADFGRRMQLIYPQASAPGARDSNRTRGRQCAREQCSRTGDICSDAQHASGSPLCACAIASWMFCVLGLPWQAVMKAYLTRKTTVHYLKETWRDPSTSRSLLRMTTRLINSLTSTYPAHSNLISALDLPPQVPAFSPCTHDCHLCRSVDALAD